jgi:hypothetical protein
MLLLIHRKDSSRIEIQTIRRDLIDLKIDNLDHVLDSKDHIFLDYHLVGLVEVDCSRGVLMAEHGSVVALLGPMILGQILGQISGQNEGLILSLRVGPILLGLNLVNFLDRHVDLVILDLFHFD